MSQSNTQTGDIVLIAGEDLTGQEGRLAEVRNVSGAPRVFLPNANNDNAVYLVIDGGVTDDTVTLRPLSSHRNVRIRAKGTGVAGDTLVAADTVDADDAGKVRALPAAAGSYLAIGLAEESFVDGQLVLVRPLVRDAHAPTVVTLGNANGEIGGLAIGAAYNQTEAQALRDKCEELADDLRAIHAALIAQGLVSAS